MRLLKNIYFLNSASMLYAEVNLNGNIHITGKNGSGKTSLLRAILFFYNPDTQNLGIGLNQKNFTDFYFPQINSYIVYEIEKENLTYMVIAYKRQNRVAFRVIETSFKQENFIKENQVMVIQDILQTFHHEGKFVSNTIDTYKDFKNLIYSSTNEYKRYSIFDSKGINYQSIPRTIGNIFLNYKLDSQFIKKSIINSIMEEPPIINLNSLNHQLANFHKHYSNINIFNSHFRSAKNIIDIYTKLNDFENSKKEIAGMLGYKLDNNNIEKFKIEAEIKDLNDKLKGLLDQLKVLEAEYNNKIGEFNFKIRTLKDKIDEAKNKDEDYKKRNIEEVIKAVQNKQIIQSELEAVNTQLSLLKSKNLDIHKRYELLKKEIIQIVEKEENDCKQKENILQKQLLDNKEEVRVDIETQIKEVELKYQALLENIAKNKTVISDILNNLNTQHIEAKHSNPLKDEIDRICKVSEDYNSEINAKKFEIKDFENKAANFKIQINFRTEQYNKDIILLRDKHQFEIKDISDRLTELTEKLESSENSFSNFLEKNYLGYEENIAKLVSEDILFNTNLYPEIKENSNLFFGINLNLSELPKAKTISDYKNEKENIEKRIEIIQKQYKNKLENLNNTHRTDSESLEKKLSEQEKNTTKINKEIADLNTLLSGNEIKLNNKNKESLEIKNKNIENINSEILKEKANIEKFNQEEKSLKSQRTDEINNLNDNKKQKLHYLENNYNNQVKELNEALENFKESNRKKVKDINIEYHKELQNNGIDNTKIIELERRQILINKDLRYIEDNSRLYYSYLADKTNLIDKIEEFQNQSKSINLDKDLYYRDFKDKESIFLEEINKTRNRINDSNKILSDIENELKNFDSFKQSSIYKELSEYVINEKFFIAGDHSITDSINRLTSIKTEIMQTVTTLREKTIRYVDHFEDNNIFAFKNSIYSDKDSIDFAFNLNNFIQDERIKEYEKELSQAYSLIISSLSQQMNEINSKEGEVQKTISKINGSFEKTRMIDVIKDIELKIKPSNNRVIHFLNKIKEFNEQNPFVGEFNLFNQVSNKDNENKAINLLSNLKQSITELKSDKISLEESFEIEFRIKENNNDTGFTERLSSIGSNGTDVLVKAMIYITLLDVAKSKLKIKDFKVHCIIDEVGILDNNYLRYLIKFANEKDILLINGSPNPAFLYDYIYRVRKDQKSNSIVIPLIEMRINEATTQPSQESATVSQ